MRLFYALALACGFSTVLLAQERPVCNIIGSTPPSLFCTLCEDNITPDGVIIGDINFFLAKNDDFTLPAFCGSGEDQSLLALGDATFTLFPGGRGNNRGTLRIPVDILIDPSAADFVIETNANNGNVTVFYGRLRFDRTGDNTLLNLQAAIRSSAVAAPVELLSWTATPTNEGVALTWSSALEVNNAYYGIEHSTDGTSFTEIAQVAGSELSVQPLDYTYLHPTPATGTNYYRLTQTDLDGTRTVFNVLTVTVDGTTATTLFPNPASAGTSIRLGTAPTTVETTLHHLDGRLITRYPAGLQRLPLPGDLATGLYLVRSGERISRLLVR